MVLASFFLTNEEIETQVSCLGTSIELVAKPGLDAGLLILRLVHFLSFPSWWSQCSGFCLNLHGLQSASPPLLQESKMALSRPGLPADVSLISLLFSAAVTGLWHYHLAVQLKYRVQKDG